MEENEEDIKWPRICKISAGEDDLIFGGMERVAATHTLFDEKIEVGLKLNTWYTT